MNSKPKIYIADLRHIAGNRVANSCMPLGIAYMKAVMDRDLPEVDSKLFAYPDHLLEEMKSDAPDVLMLTNYIWNDRLARHFSQVAKRLRPDALVVVGGPNIHVEEDRQISFYENWRDLDIYVLGEGDFLATEIVKRFLDAGKSIDKLVKGGIPSSIFRSDGMVIHQPMQAKERQLDKIPSPWLNGVQDQFFDGKLFPLIETNRGCPFKCTYCVQGDNFYNRMSHFDEDQVKEELTYIARRVKEVCPKMGVLMIADPNFAMYKRDVNIAAHIGTLQKEFNWPSFIDASTGKNTPDKIIKSIELTGGALGMLHAVQSLDENVLRSVKRDNIKLETYEKVTEHMSDRGLRTFSQTILCLPNETLQIHLTGLHQLIDGGIDRLQNMQLMLLKGSEIESQDSREKFEFEPRFRVSPRCFGNYGGDKVFDMEEVVISTKSFSFEDYLEARKHHLTYMVFWSQDWFDGILHFARNVGIKSSTCLEAMVKAMKSDEGLAGKFMQEFIEETKGELFLTEEECIKFYTDENHFEKLVSGEIGDNLLNKYHAMASFVLWPQICKLATNVVKEILLTHASDKLEPGFDHFWADLCRFVEFKHATGQTLGDILPSVSSPLHYDIPKWEADGRVKEISRYRLEEEKSFMFRLSEIGAREISDAMETWPTNIPGLTKVARHLKVTSQVRQCV